ncbi:MAG: dihydroorotate dehydrogenase-like protein [Phycicoccus sp.]|nr:dihydroorotate dehydrogenase-like protein [Phycicoccus sp.]NMM35111.1 dihydroorotate dehydrogenase-like protein [Phycicoccus sp.]
MTAELTVVPEFDLSTTYLGLQLRSPLVASSGPLTARIDSLLSLEQAGVAAVVLPSLFEEQIEHEDAQADRLADLHSDSNPEATGYFPDQADYESVADRYLRHLEEAKKALSIPVVASLNGETSGGWVRYARLLELAGADAIELNLYGLAADLDVTGRDVEDEQVELVALVKASLSIPLAVKIGPNYSALGNQATRFIDAGADGLVLFNRFYQPDIDPKTRKVAPALELSSSAELRLPLRWTAILSGRVEASLAVTTGVHTGADVARCLLAGADVAMMTSSLLVNGAGHVAAVERELVEWAAESGFESVAQLKGSVSQRNVADPSAFERANYMSTLIGFTNSFR